MTPVAAIVRSAGVVRAVWRRSLVADTDGLIFGWERLILGEVQPRELSTTCDAHLASRGVR